ncbi:MAG: addiction module protein [Pirellulaceae bacterium]|nr:addiction module protein [Pirellulaceae bacterium]
MTDFLEQIRKLPVPEQLLLVERIWDGLHDSAALVQAWHRDEGKRRLSELARDPSYTIDRDELRKRVDDLVDE